MHIYKKWRNVLLTMNEGTSKHNEPYSNETMNKAKIDEKCFFHLRKQSFLTGLRGHQQSFSSLLSYIKGNFIFLLESITKENTTSDESKASSYDVKISSSLRREAMGFYLPFIYIVTN